MEIAAVTGSSIPYNISTYLVQCSFLATPSGAFIDMQTNSLLSPVSMSQQSVQWEIYNGPSPSSIKVCQTALIIMRVTKLNDVFSIQALSRCFDKLGG